MEPSQVNPLADTKYMKPQEHWGWPIAIDLYLAGIGAGSFIIGAFIDRLGYSVYPSKAVLFWGVLLVALAVPFLILDLGIKWRFLNACLNPRTSWLSRGSIIITLFIITGIATLVVSLLPLLSINVASLVFQMLEIAGVVMAFATAVYTGLLLKAVKYITLWSTWLLPVLFLSSALATGCMVVILSVSGAGLLLQRESSQLMAMLASAQQALILLEGLALGLFLFLRYRTSAEGERSVRLLLSGSQRYVFWIGSIVCHYIVPFILLRIYSPGFTYLLFIAGFFLLTGGFFFRLGIVQAGIKEQPPMSRLIGVSPNSAGSLLNTAGIWNA